MAAEWPQDTPLHVVGAALTDVVGRSQQYGVQLSPESSPPVEWIDLPPSSRLGRYAFARLAGAPESVKHLRNTFPSDHMTITLSRGIRWLAYAVRTGGR